MALMKDSSSALGWTCRLGCFHIYEASSLSLNPTIRPRMFGNRMAAIAFLSTFPAGALTFWRLYFMALYLRACRLYQREDRVFSFFHRCWVTSLPPFLAGSRSRMETVQADSSCSIRAHSPRHSTLRQPVRGSLPLKDSHISDHCGLRIRNAHPHNPARRPGRPSGN